MYFPYLVCHTTEQKPQPASKTEARTRGLSFPWENTFGSGQSRNLWNETSSAPQPPFTQKTKWKRIARTGISLHNWQLARCRERDKGGKALERDEVASGWFARNFGAAVQNQAHRYFVSLIQLGSLLETLFLVEQNARFITAPKGMSWNYQSSISIFFSLWFNWDSNSTFPDSCLHRTVKSFAVNILY